MHDSTVVKYEIGGLKFSKLAVINDRVGDDVTCIVPFDVTSETESGAFCKAIEECKGGVYEGKAKSADVKVLTRSLDREEELLDKCDTDVVTDELWSVVAPDEGGGNVQGPSSQPDPLNMPEVQSRVGEGRGVEDAETEVNAEQPQANGSTENVESEDMEGVPVDLSSVSACEGETEGVVRKLASEIGPMKEGSDCEEFKKELREDESLREWRELADKSERKFAWRKGMLVRSQYVSWEVFRDVLVVPKSFRKRIVEMSHERGGHLSGDKVARMVGRYFVWPGMVREICEHCRSWVVPSAQQTCAEEGPYCRAACFDRTV